MQQGPVRDPHSIGQASPVTVPHRKLTYQIGSTRQRQNETQQSVRDSTIEESCHRPRGKNRSKSINSKISAQVIGCTTGRLDSHRFLFPLAVEVNPSAASEGVHAHVIITRHKTNGAVLAIACIDQDPKRASRPTDQDVIREIASIDCASAR